MFGVLLYIFFVCLTTTNWFYMKNSVHTFISNYESWHKLRFNDSFFCCSTVFRHFSVISMALSVFWLLQTTTGVALESKNYTFLKFARNKKQRTLNILTIYCRRDQLFFCLHSPVGSSFCMQSGKVKKNNRTTVPCTEGITKWKQWTNEKNETTNSNRLTRVTSLTLTVTEMSAHICQLCCRRRCRFFYCSTFYVI